MRITRTLFAALLLAITGADEVVRAVLLTNEEAGHLQVPARSPALEVVAVGFLAGERPLWWECTLYRADQYEFQSRLGPIQSVSPFRGQLRQLRQLRAGTDDAA